MKADIDTVKSVWQGNFTKYDRLSWVWQLTGTTVGVRFIQFIWCCYTLHLLCSFEQSILMHPSASTGAAWLSKQSLQYVSKNFNNSRCEASTVLSALEQLLWTQREALIHERKKREIDILLRMNEGIKKREEPFSSGLSYSEK